MSVPVEIWSWDNSDERIRNQEGREIAIVESEEAARLIVAAPELLTALEGMDEAICAGHETREARDIGRRALIACRAAIAKAKGVEP